MLREQHGQRDHDYACTLPKGANTSHVNQPLESAI
jgi:hypothetical protein